MADCEPASLPLPAVADDQPQAAEGGAAADSEQTNPADSSVADCGPPSTDAPPTPAAAAGGDAPLSKRQQKRLARREAYLEQRPALRRAERQRRKEKRAAAIAAAVAAGAAPLKRPRLTPMASGSDVRVVIDLSFDALMTERDLGKCLKQVQRCYAANRRAPRPVQLLLTSMDGESRRLMDINDGWRNWDVRVEQQHVLDVLPAETVTYLTSDSENELSALLPGTAYVIGGLVDHNHHKGECLRRAHQAGISHARLPIDHFLEMKTRKVLTIDHVFKILLLVAGGGGWQEALQTVLPARKGAVLKDGCGEEDSGADSAAETAGEEASPKEGDVRPARAPVETGEGDKAPAAGEPAAAADSESVAAGTAEDRETGTGSGQITAVVPNGDAGSGS